MLKPYLKRNRIEVGCDEAGRGCLAGPVFAAAVILPKGYKNKLLNDSKKLNEKSRDLLRIEIEKEAIAWAVARIDHKGIDKINILNASIKAMQNAIGKLTIKPEHILVDGNRFKPYKKISFDCIIKGDGKFASIAAASILAKTHRDGFMKRLHKRFPYYGWDANKGYPTQFHRNAIIEHGPCKYHRQSFRLYPLPEQGTLF